MELRKVNREDIERVFARAGLRLADLDPNAVGVPMRDWILEDQRRQCDAWLETQDRAAAPLSKQRQWNPRDDYGWRTS
jgi:hypothetical protein